MHRTHHAQRDDRDAERPRQTSPSSGPDGRTQAAAAGPEMLRARQTAALHEVEELVRREGLPASRVVATERGFEDRVRSAHPRGESSTGPLAALLAPLADPPGDDRALQDALDLVREQIALLHELWSRLGTPADPHRGGR